MRKFAFSHKRDTPELEVNNFSFILAGEIVFAKNIILKNQVAKIFNYVPYNLFTIFIGKNQLFLKLENSCEPHH